MHHLGRRGLATQYSAIVVPHGLRYQDRRLSACTYVRISAT